ncbi:pseudouridine synthase [Sulfurimicrobium lacus]|uniref:Pseudouridine synthase n=1 Tax=Sulfurimicrobium lacus TaxID=2715678 RepID=A0A6F8VD55_9PROT|nr:23S rRNA pseudouridine(1911/1915/1917) synthase RluD [Sulfurimicrobium lacus]BCB27753.1 pseudouridine synthase [Sulfurimicrobium lacus]
MTESEKNLTDYNRNAPQLQPHSPLLLEIPSDCSGLRLDQALSTLLPEYSRSRLQAWIKDGHVKLNGAVVIPRHIVWQGDQAEVETQLAADEIAFRPEDIALDIVYEDDSLLVINKPAGLVVHPGSGNWQGTMLNALLHHAPQLAGIPRAGIVHRLDKDTSGLLVVAKTFTAQTDLVRQLQARSVKREYLAVVQGAPQETGSVEAPIGRHPTQRIKMAVVQYGKPALTHFALVERFAHYSLVRCQLETGRTHQIRVHMQHLGFPLLGDPVYAGKGMNIPVALREAVKGFTRQALHATRLGLIHPVSGEAMEWRVDMPDDMAALLEALRNEDR